MPNPATAATALANAAAGRALPFADTQDFEDAARGLVAPLADDGVVRRPDGRVVWDLTRFAFGARGSEAPDTVHPSLWRQLQLLTLGGLFEVTEGVYQVRSTDLANMDIIEGDTGVIVVDPLTSAETARAALDLYAAHRGQRPVRAVIHTHSHIDHFGGVKGVVRAVDVAEGRTRIIAPAGFTEAAVSENVMAGNVMGRRASYMYGDLLPAGPTGGCSPGLGIAVSNGSIGFLAPTHEITEPVQEMVIDGVRVTFMLAPDTEAPAEMLFHLPGHRALCSAEDATHTLHNLYTLRGARTRDARMWAHYLNKAIELFGTESDVVFGQHHWPTWGRDRVLAFLEHQRDAYKYLHDQTLRLANHGLTMAEIAEQLELPPELGGRWYNRDYYGTVNHNVKAVYDLYLGWFDGNPATLHPLPEVEAARRYVEMMGGPVALLANARVYYERGEYRWVAQVVNHLVFAEPTNEAARALQADALEQLGYQAESGVWRNFYLSGAQELRQGITPSRQGPVNARGVAAALPIDMLFDYLAIALNGPKAAGKRISINFEFTDTGQRLALELVNSVLHTSLDRQLADPDVTVRLPDALLRQVAVGRADLSQALADGQIVLVGNAAALAELLSLFDAFEFWFPIVEP